MANRILRDWTQSENINRISEKAEVFFTRLIMKADDFGIFYGNIKLIKSALYPLRDIQEKEIHKSINECIDNGLIILYSVENKDYIKINNFGQRLRIMKSKFPQPNDGTLRTDVSTSPLETEDETEDETDIHIFNFKTSLINYGFKINLINDWLKIRKTKKATNTETAFNKFIKQVELTKMDKNLVLERCVEKSWSGFEADWIKQESKKIDPLQYSI